MTDVMAHEEILAQTDFFADAHPDALRAVADAGHELHLIRGDVLFNEGERVVQVDLTLRARGQWYELGSETGQCRASATRSTVTLEPHMLRTLLVTGDR